MFWAIVNNEKIEPIPKTYGTCPLCEGKVLSKCGEVKVWHWAHLKGESCDSWYEPESYWHFHWKMIFGKKNAEIVIKKNGKWHIADIHTSENVVIELQNSPIKKTTIREREEFYGERMIWLINGIHFKQNFSTLSWDDARGEWRLNHDRNFNTDEKILFKWHYPRRSWKDVQRNVFIDFNDEKLFWIKEGMGSSIGYGVFVSKEDFIQKYEGNYEYYCQQYSNRDETK